eukprot:6455576-Amphidinium_carterae.1
MWSIGMSQGFLAGCFCLNKLSSETSYVWNCAQYERIPLHAELTEFVQFTSECIAQNEMDLITTIHFNIPLDSGQHGRRLRTQCCAQLSWLAVSAKGETDRMELCRQGASPPHSRIG